MYRVEVVAPHHSWLKATLRSCVHSYRDSPKHGELSTMSRDMKSRIAKMRSLWLLLSMLALAEVSDAQDYCGAPVYNDTSGTIYSPRFLIGGDYRPESNCTYDVKATKLSNISLTFLTLDLEIQTSCNYDWVQIGCASHQTGIARRYCGQIPPNATITFSPCTDVRIDFHSDSTVNKKGFSIQYEVNEIECVGNCTPVSNSYGYVCPCDANQQNLSLPTIRPSRTCPSDCLISDEFAFCTCARSTTTTATSSSCAPGCYSSTNFFGDTICRCDGTTTPSSSTCAQGCYRTTDWLGYPYCNCPSTTYRPLFCSFGCFSDTDYWGNRYCNCPASTQPPLWCSSGCTSAVDADGSRYCRCSTTTLVPCFSPCYYSWDYSVDFSGRRYCFCPTTTTNPPPTGCNQTLTATSGSVTSPNYPNMYTKGIDCTQQINVPMATSVKLRLIELNVNYYDTYTCRYEYIEITGCDGSYGVYCTSSNFPTTGLVFQCTDNSIVTINFHSSESSYYSYRGFKLTYTANFGANCTEPGMYLSDGQTDVLTSPSFPGNFPSFSECYNYIFTDSDDVRIKITFEQLRLDESTDCGKVSLRLTCQDESAKSSDGSFREVCGSRIPASITFDCRVLQIWFRSNSTDLISPRGFKMRYYGISTQPSTVSQLDSPDSNSGQSDLSQSARIGIGLGVGVGGFFLIILVVIIIVLVVGNQRQAARRDRRHLEELAVVCRNMNNAGSGGSVPMDSVAFWRAQTGEGFVNPIHDSQQHSSDQLPAYQLAAGNLAETSSLGGFTAEKPKTKLVE